MIELTKKEQETILLIYKNFTSYYNANSLAKEVSMSQVGAMKLLKKIGRESILVSKKIGKSYIYKINIGEEIVRKLIAFVLINESRKFTRWKEEFKSLNKSGRIILFYGSAIRNYTQARDIDIMVVLNRGDMKEVRDKVAEIQKILPKKIHLIEATKNDLIENLKNKNKAMIDIIKTAIVLYGYEDYMESINGFTNF